MGESITCEYTTSVWHPGSGGIVGYIAAVSSTAPPRPVRPDARTFRRRRLVALLILLGLIGAVVAGVVAVKNRLFPADPPPVEPAAAPTGPTEEELANPTECAA